jgi:hypothetical protein
LEIAACHSNHLRIQFHHINRDTVLPEESDGSADTQPKLQHTVSASASAAATVTAIILIDVAKAGIVQNHLLNGKVQEDGIVSVPKTSSARRGGHSQ